MERPYATGGGLRQLVDLFQHHVAFTTHPDFALAWELGRERGSEAACERLFRRQACGSTTYALSIQI